MKRWYVVQIYAGYEEAIKKDLEREVAERGLKDFFGEVLIPSAKAKQGFQLIEQDKVDQQLFPGYILIEMDAVPEAIKLVQSAPRVLKFLGGKNPVPLSKKEVERIVAQMKGEVAIAPKKSDFVEGSEIEITEGPFAGFVGVIDKIEDESERLVVMVSIFGRMTPIELGFNQVKR
ncbi:MAG: transcription termination/antitermination protein NusG [Candidatus Babeliales bacterium]